MGPDAPQRFAGIAALAGPAAASSSQSGQALERWTHGKLVAPTSHYERLDELSARQKMAERLTIHKPPLPLCVDSTADFSDSVDWDLG